MSSLATRGADRRSRGLPTPNRRGGNKATKVVASSSSASSVSSVIKTSVSQKGSVAAEWLRQIDEKSNARSWATLNRGLRIALGVICGMLAFSIVFFLSRTQVLTEIIEERSPTSFRSNECNEKHENEKVKPFPFSPRPWKATQEEIDLAAEQFPKSLQMRDLSEFDILIVGAGLSGTVLADLFARKHDKKVLMLEKRPHIGGNCYDFHESRTGILVNLYGAHLFHTNKQDVWKYVHRFSEWTPYEHRVIGRVDGKLVPIPVNIDTVNLLFGEKVASVEEMKAWLEHEREESGATAAGGKAENSKEVGISRVGSRLYQKLFREYTKKQWNVYPEDLGPVVLSRIPVRNDWDDRYFPNDKYQALPGQGYTKWFEEALDHPNIEVFTSTDYFEMLKNEPFAKKVFEKTFFTGQIDQFFRNKGVELKPLQYRSIKFEATIVDEPAVNQPAFVVNYPQFHDGKHTRTAEYKHMYHQDSPRSILIREYSTDIKDGAEPYYPFPTVENQEHFQKYKELAVSEEETSNVHFVGRLANYKYFNMDDAIKNALELYERLEGRERLDEALSEGTAPSFNSLVAHYVVHNTADVDLSWIPALCSRFFWRSIEGEKVHSKLFVYNSDRKKDAQLHLEIEGALQEAGCPKLRLGHDLFIRNIDERNPMELSWLEYFNSNTFGFGDINIFSSATLLKSEMPQLDEILSIQVLKLFRESRTRASQPKVIKNNVRRVHPSDWASFSVPLKQLRGEFVPTLQMLPLSGTVPRGAEGGGLRKDEGSTGALGDLYFEDEVPKRSASNCPALQQVNFVATDAIIRRMLARYRTALHDKIIPGIRANPGSSPFLKLVQNEWLCMFFDEA